MSLMDALDASMPGVSPGVFDEADFRAISEIAHAEAGIVLPSRSSSNKPQPMMRRCSRMSSDAPTQPVCTSF